MKPIIWTLWPGKTYKVSHPSSIEVTGVDKDGNPQIRVTLLEPVITRIDKPVPTTDTIDTGT